jgi:hypothetical protein
LLDDVVRVHPRSLPKQGWIARGCEEMGV